MKKLLRISTFALFSCAALAQAPVLTTVTGSFYGASGTVMIAATNTFTTADGFVIPKGYEVTTTLINGMLSVALPPNVTSTPSGTSYAAYYNVSPGGQFVETWAIPASPSTVNVSAVRSLTPPSPAMTFALSQVTPMVGCGSKYLTVTSDGTGWTCNAPPGSGTVTSVGLTMPGSIFTVTGSPVTSSGTLEAALANQSANAVLAGPASGSSAAPAFRVLNAADIAAAGTLTNATSGNAATANALASAPSQCASGQFAQGIATSGNAQGCAAPLTPSAVPAALLLPEGANRDFGPGGNAGLNTVAVAMITIPTQFIASKLTIYDYAPGSTGSTVDVGLYGVSGNLLFSYSSASGAPLVGTVSGLAQATISPSVALAPGQYFEAWCVSWTSPPQPPTMWSDYIWTGQTTQEAMFNATTPRFGTAGNTCVNGTLPATLGALSATVTDDRIPGMVIEH